MAGPLHPLGAPSLCPLPSPCSRLPPALGANALRLLPRIPLQMVWLSPSRRDAWDAVADGIQGHLPDRMIVGDRSCLVPRCLGRGMSLPSLTSWPWNTQGAYSRGRVAPTRRRDTGSVWDVSLWPPIHKEDAAICVPPTEGGERGPPAWKPGLRSDAARLCFCLPGESQSPAHSGGLTVLPSPVASLPRDHPPLRPAFRP